MSKELGQTNRRVRDMTCHIRKRIPSRRGTWLIGGVQANGVTYGSPSTKTSDRHTPPPPSPIASHDP